MNGNEFESLNETNDAITITNATGRPVNYEKNNHLINIRLTRRIVRIEFKYHFTVALMNKIAVFILLILQRIFGRFRNRGYIGNDRFVEYFNNEHHVMFNLRLIPVEGDDHFVLNIVQSINYNNNTNGNNINVSTFYRLDIDVINKLITGIDVLSRERNITVENYMRRNAGIRRFPSVALKERYERRYESPVAGFELNVPGENRGSRGTRSRGSRGTRSRGSRGTRSRGSRGSRGTRSRGTRSTIVIPGSKRHTKRKSRKSKKHNKLRKQKHHRRTRAQKQRRKLQGKDLKELKELLILNNEF